LARHTSRTSTTLAPPSVMTEQTKRSPSASLRHFPLNPEAREFQPGTSSFVPAKEFAPTPNGVPSTEQYLQLSIPVPTPTKELAESLGGLATPPGQGGLHTPQGRDSRPSISRATSNVSGVSSWRDGRSRTSTNTPTAMPDKPGPQKPIHTCSICWICVSGRFYLCPACGHVAHFDCMDDEIGMDDGECVVGCGCGCGLEDNDERSRMEAYLEEVRAAHAAGITWEEGDEWLQMAPHSEPATPGLYAESLYGDFMTGGASKMAGHGEEKRRERLTGRSTANASPTPSKDKKKKSKAKKKKVRASGLSYY